MKPHEEPEQRAGGSPSVRSAQLALDAQVAGRTLCGVLAWNARVRGQRAALRYSEGGDWRPLTWQALRRMVGEAALGLQALGLGPGDVLVVRSPPRPEALALDLAALHLRAVPVFFDPGGSAHQLVWTSHHCGARAVATVGPLPPRTASQLPDVALLDIGGQGAGGSALPLASLLRAGRTALEADPRRLDLLTGRVRPDDVATLCYGPTPGGSMRATVVTHRAALWAAASIRAWARGLVAPGQRTVAHLPLSHSAGRLFGHYLVLWGALEAYCCPVPALVPDAVAGARPSILVSVPLVWERLTRTVRRGAPLPPGLQACRLPVSAGGPLPARVARRLREAGVPLLDMYGLTETFGPVTAHRPGRPRAGTVGLPMPGLDVTIDQGEVVVRTPAGAAGYLHDPGSTAATFGTGGIVRTADLGYFDTEGHLVLTGRSRDLLVTAGGRNVAPRPLERALAEQPGVGRACVLGEGRPFVAALVAVPATAPPGRATPDLAALEAVQAAVERVNAGLARGDRIRTFRVVTDDWSVETGELRPDGLCNRNTVERRYATLVEDLYTEVAPGADAPGAVGSSLVR